MATIYDVARRAKVSTYTVSAVLNRSANVSPELTARVHQAVKDLNYTVNEVARSLPLRKTRTVGMLIPDIANPFYAKMVRAVEDRLRVDGYSLLLGSMYNDAAEQKRYLALLRGKQVDGLVLFAAAGDEEELRRLVDDKKPAVFVGRAPRTFEADLVLADGRLGAQIATEYLIGHGHERIAMVSGQLALSNSIDRVNGWRAALAARNLAVPDEYLREGDWTAAAGERHAYALFDLADPPTAILSANFLTMTGILRALRRRNRPTRDVEIVSWDDSDWLDIFDPPITTIVTSSYSMGEKAAELLLKRMRQPGRKAQKIVMLPELRIRGREGDNRNEDH